MAKALGGEIIPRWGISRKVSSDNEVEYFGIDMRTRCANHPANGGAVDRENGTLKKLKHVSVGLGPLVLTHMRARVRCRSGLSPFEELFSRPLNTGI